ncbi:MAG TPA: ABC transporter permease [Gemmatimonadaceae bacterium]|nr:ABC transporter permease [Gemmatimonadaceae bacterium]
MRFYRALLHLYPAGFRAEYEAELRATFAERMRGASGPLAPLRVTLAAIADVVPNAVAAHWDLLRQDLRHALRSLRRTPGFTVTAVLLVALGVGANTAAFSLADYVLLRPLPFPEPERLVRLWQSTAGYGRNQLSPANYRDWKASARSVESMGAYTGRAMNLVGAAEPRRLQTVAMTPELFPLLGVPAFAGRTFTPGDSADGNVVVLGHALWASQFGGDPHVIGSVVRLDGAPYTVIGVMPPSFRFPDRETDAWVPLLLREQDFVDRTDTYIDVVARLRRGASLAQARSEFSEIAARLERQYPKENERTGALVVGLRDQLSERSRLLVLAVGGAALCILLLACANLASLLLTRAAHRSHELAVRAALGAGRERLVRQLLTESITLAAIGGVAGVAVAMAGVPLLARLVPDTLPTAAQPGIDLRVLAVAVVLVWLTGIAFGVAPAVAAGRGTALDALRDGTRASGGRTARVRAALVVIEVAASVVLLVSSGLLLRAALRIQGTDPGFHADGVLTLRTALPFSKYAITARREQFYDRVLRDVRALPGVRDAAYVTGLPLSMRGGIWPTSIAGSEAVVLDPSNSVSLRFVTPRYFATLGIPLRRGRDVTAADGPASPLVAVVSESFARRNWPNEPAIGKRFTVAQGERTIVGVVGDVRFRGLEQQSEPQVYLPSAQMPDSSFIAYPPKELVVRTSGGAGAPLPAIRRIVHAADPEQPISNVRTMAEIVADETASRVTQLRLLGALSAIALLIAGVGIHGLLGLTVSRRSREIGVRMALGEQAGSIVRRVLREGLGLALAGVGIGVVVAYLSARAMAALLAGIRPGDPATIGAAVALCLVTAAAGCVRAATRAARVDPSTALRAE